MFFWGKKKKNATSGSDPIITPGITGRQVKPIKLHPKTVAPIKKSIEEFFLKSIYKPLMDDLNKSLKQREKVNSKSAVINAIKGNKISYANGQFSGKFSAPISKGLRDMGAKFDRHTKTFKISSAAVPPDVKSALAVSQSTLKTAYKQFDDNLANINNIVDTELEKFNIKDNELFDDLAKQYSSSVKTIGVEANLSDATLEVLREEYREGLKSYIKGWTDEAVVRLRGTVQQSVLNRGLRSEDLIDAIKSEYGVSQKKAEFLSRQESSLVMSKYREESFKQSGVQRYKWSTSGDSKVRQDHKDLDGKIFSWDSPPIEDKSTGRRGAPGEGFGCRCTAIPIV